jgi:ADP-ribose pyrophosphatase
MKIKHADKLTHLQWLNMFDVTYVDKNGRNRSWQVVSRQETPKCMTGKFKQPDAVVIVPFHRTQKKVVISKEFRVPLAGYEYGFPAGLIDAGETIEDAARRELREETGLTLTRTLKISPPIYSSAGMTDESVAMVYVECDGEPSVSRNAEAEVIEVELISQPEATRLCKDPGLKFDAKAYLVLTGFAANGDLK